MLLVIYVIVIVNVSSISRSEAVIVSLPDGNVRGISNTTLKGTPYHSFLALRYAQPPLGSLRYHVPKPVEPWDGIYDATTEKNICYQLASNNVLESEDCLFVNVFTPADLSNASFASGLSVMVWIHGGGFVSGSGTMSFSALGPKFFMDSNVLLVTFNYRLGAFGFLSLGDDILPGNYGLKDQVLALKWVQSNIEYFGGDPGKVTIFGQSSGGSSVGYHLLSKLSRGLFRAAILMSGSALSPMAYQRNATYYAHQTLQYLDPSFNLTLNSSMKALTLLRSMNASEIDEAAYTLTTKIETPANYQLSKGFFYGPTREVCQSGAFLTKIQYEAFEHGNYNKVPVLIGNTDEESLALARLSSLSFLWDAYDAEPSILVPFDMHISNSTLKQALGSKIMHYFGGADGFKNDSAKVIKYHSVHDLDRGNLKQAELMAAHSTVFFYQFAYSGKMGNNPYQVEGTGKVAHSEDLNYIFSRSYNDDIPDNTNLTQFNVTDQLVHFRLMSLWTNFAKFLDPTPLDNDRSILQNITWNPVTAQEFKYLKIDTDLEMILGYTKPDPYQFWSDLYENYAVPPLDTF